MSEGSVSYEVEGDEPTSVVVKTGGGNDQLYEFSGGASGTVTAGQGDFVGDERTTSNPCPAGQETLKFEDGTLSTGSTLSIGTEGGSSS